MLRHFQEFLDNNDIPSIEAIQAARGNILNPNPEILSVDTEIYAMRVFGDIIPAVIKYREVLSSDIDPASVHVGTIATSVGSGPGNMPGSRTAPEEVLDVAA